jgi:hypothetical protein
VDGYRLLDIVKDNPDWWMLELLDGFGSHVNCHEANMYRWQKKVLSLKEEGDSSHINQAYDRFTAKNDKRIHREALQWLQRDKFKTETLHPSGTLSIVDWHVSVLLGTIQTYGRSHSPLLTPGLQLCYRLLIGLRR